uniref:Phenoloxidase-activating factor 2 n=1 Tax=Photinus pyralis TaxID=7054 RepID=A0A1Y1N5M6_PHOPY
MKLILFLVFPCLLVSGDQQNGTKSKDEELPIASFISSNVDGFVQEPSNSTSSDNLATNCDCKCKSDENTIDIHGVDYCIDDFCCTSKSIKSEVRCGRRGQGRATVHVNEASMGEFPWMVAMLREKDAAGEISETLHCGASLIHPQVVLTAAHCVHNKNDSYKIRAGEWDISGTNELYPHQDRGIKETIVHPRYRSGTLFYDVALLVLESPVQLTENVDVVCLPDKSTVVSSNLFCYGTGWGRKVFTEEKTNSTILKKVELAVVDREACLKRLKSTRLGSHFKLHETFICAGGEIGLDLCKGDGGGPLVCPVPDEDGRFYQAGIVAWGINCGEDIPGAYVDIVKVIDWIDDIMISQHFDTTIYHY